MNFSNLDFNLNNKINFKLEKFIKLQDFQIEGEGMINNITFYSDNIIEFKKVINVNKNLEFKSNKIFSPKKDCYKGTTIKFSSKKVKIKFTNIFLKDLHVFDEILVVGSGKGIVSVSSIDNNSWKRKSFKLYKKLTKIYKLQVNQN